MPSHKFQDRENMVFHVPAGEYVLGIEKAELELAKSSGNEQIKLTCRVLTDKGEGPTVFDYLQFGEKSDWKIDVFLKAIKCTPKKGEVVEIDADFLNSRVVGKLGWATLIVDEYQGRKNNKIVQWITNHKIDAYAKFQVEKPAPVAGDQQESGEDFK